MGIMTVEGLVESRELGVVSPHEHVLVDIRNQFTEPCEASRRALAEQPVSIANLDVRSRNPYAVRDTRVLDEPPLAEKELLFFKRAGGDAIVDATSRGIGRDPQALLSVARATGIKIIAGCGYYTCDTHPPELDGWPGERIRDELIQELTGGSGPGRIRAGVIGEIGTSEWIHPNEEKVLRAAAGAHKATNAGIIVHTFPWSKKGLDIVEILTGGGVAPGKISINHIDVEIDLEYCRALLKRGVYIEFDDFGKEYFIDSWNRGFAGGVFARDIERVQAIKTLAAEGGAGQILVSTDICLKTLLHTYGGWGYDHILVHILPMMREQGIPDEQVDLVVRENPKRFLDLGI